MAKKILILTIIVLFKCTISNSQRWDWAQKIGNVKSDKITCIKTDGLGYIYIAGYFSTSTTIGTNALMLNFTANANSKEAFIAKLDSTGFCLWAKSGGAYFDDRVLGMDVDSAGYAIITGTFWEGSGINFPPINVTGSTWGNNDQCFIVRFDPNGNPLWGNYVCGDKINPSGGNYRDDQGLDVATDRFGNSYVVGFMTTVTLYCGGNTVTATNPNTGLHKHCYWLAKIDSTGVFKWARTFGNLPWDGSYKYIERDIAVCVDEKDGVYVTGGFDSTRHFGPLNFTTHGGYDIFAMKYDSSGNFMWATQGGSKKDDWSNGICSDKHGSIYITGEHRDSLLMDTVIVKNYDKRDVFVMKLDASTGRAIWGKRAGSDLGNERGNDVWADTNCNIYVCGDINEGAKFGDDITVPTGSLEQAFIAKISPEGKWTWVITGGGIDSNDRCNAIAKGKGNQVYAAGYFRSPATYGTTNLTSVGSSDGFFARIYDSSLNKGTPFVLTAPTDTVLCLGDTAKLTIPKHAYFEITPTTGFTANADFTEINFAPLTTTTYKLSGFSKGECPEYDTVIFTIRIAPDPIADFVITPPTIMITNPTFTLTNNSFGGDSYEWYYGGNLFSTSSTIAQNTFGSAGIYCFTLWAKTNDGCSDSITHCGKIVNEEKVFFPNAFSPNNDKLNDEFKPLLLNIEFADVKNYSLVIFNRYGEKVFESDKPQYGWNGTKRGDGKNCDLGVYYYSCQFVTPFGKKYDVKGDVTLVR